MSAIVEVRGVSKSLGGRQVVSDVSFDVDPGTICALVGPNGAGKTTMLTLLTGLRRPDRGTIKVAGVDPRSRVARHRVSIVQQEIVFPPTLRVVEILRYVAGSRSYGGRGLRCADALAALGIDTVAARQVGGLSGGQRRRLAVALALTNAGDVVVLDEATANLDAEGRAVTWRLVEQYVSAGGAVVVSSHLLIDVDEHADTVVVLDGGRVVLAGAADSVRAAGSVARVTFRVSAGCEEAVRDAVSSLGEITTDGRRAWTVRTRCPEAVVSVALAADAALSELRVSEPSVTESIASILEQQA